MNIYDVYKLKAEYDALLAEYGQAVFELMQWFVEEEFTHFRSELNKASEHQSSIAEMKAAIRDVRHSMTIVYFLHKEAQS